MNPVETQKLQEETNKLRAEAAKLEAEQRLADLKWRRYDRVTFWIPVTVLLLTQLFILAKLFYT